MKPGWMQSLISASALAALFGTFLLGQDRGPLTRLALPSARNTEWKLAGVLPGHTTLQRAKAILGEPFTHESDYRATWTTCEKKLEIRADHEGIIKAVRVTRTSDTPPAIDCFGSASGESKWVTGLGLALDDSTERVTQLYGQPDSQRPSTKGLHQIELLYYALNSQGPKLTQVMTVRCTPEKDGRPGRVLEIRLTVPTL